MIRFFNSLDRFEQAIACLIVAIVAAIVFAMGAVIHHSIVNKCVETRRELYHPPPIYVKIGDVMMPVAQAPYMTDVCVAWEKR